MAKLSTEMEGTLLAAAWEGFKNTYSPYSHFGVGAAALGENGKIYRGCNVENASYGITCCAERTAIFSMVADGCKKFTALAVVADSVALTPPCGACRQVIFEMSTGPDVPVVMSNGTVTVTKTVDELLPMAALDLATNG